MRAFRTPGVPLPVACIHAERGPNVGCVEERLHLALADRRVNPNRNFVRVNPERLRAILDLPHGTERTPIGEEPAADPTDRTAPERVRRRRGRCRFGLVGIPAGAVLRTTLGAGTTRRVLNGPDAEVRGKLTGPGEAALTVAQEHGRGRTRIPGPAYWTFEGVPPDGPLEKIRNLTDDQAETGTAREQRGMGGRNRASVPRRRRLPPLLAAGAALLASAWLCPPAAAQGQRDTLTIGIIQFPSTFHPNIENMAAKTYVLGFARRPVTAYGVDWQLTCLLCETLPTLENGLARRETTPEGKPGLRVTYRLREDARWGDGTPISAEDLRFAWEAGRNPETGFGPAEFYRSAYELIVEDPRSVTLRFDKVTFDFASLGDFQPLPAHVERPRWQSEPRSYRSRTAYDTETANPALWSGPYRIAGVQPGAGVTLERNPAWQGATPAFRRIQVRTVENTAALEAQLLAGQVDMVAGELGLPVEQVAALERRTGSRFRVAYKPGLIYEHLDLRLDNPVLADARVRQALLLAIDRAQIVARLFEGRQTVAHTSVNPLDPMHDPATREWPFDPGRAGALLEQAGWTRGPDGIRRNAAGERLSVELMTTAGNRAREAVQQVIQGMWRAAGVEARIRNEPPRVLFSETLSKRRFQGAALFAWISAPEGVPRSNLHSEEIPTETRNWSGQNYPGYRNPEMDALLEALPQELDREKRRALWSRLQAIYAEDLPVLPLWFRADAHVWPQWLDGVRPTGHLNYSSLWVEEWRVR